MARPLYLILVSSDELHSSSSTYTSISARELQTITNWVKLGVLGYMAFKIGVVYILLCRCTFKLHTETICCLTYQRPKIGS